MTTTKEATWTTLRYAVRPRRATIAGWYVWAVVKASHASDCLCSCELAEPTEQWADDSYALYPTKKEAKKVAETLNAKLTFSRRTK